MSFGSSLALNAVLSQAANQGQPADSGFNYKPGDDLPEIGFDPSNPSQTLADIVKRDTARYQRDYVPVEDRAIESLDDTSIITDAKARVADGSSIGRAQARAGRDANRYGFRRTEAQARQAQNELARGKATGDASIMNEARINQFDRNRGFRNELINIGRGVSEQAMQGLGDSATMQTNRENRNRASKAAASAQQTQMFGTVAAMALMAFV